MRWSEENQRADIEAWAAKKEVPIVAWGHSRFQSGDSGSRFDMDEVLRLLKKHGAEGIVTADLSRWSRFDVPAFFPGLEQILSSGYRVRWVAEDWLDLNLPFRWTIFTALVEKNHLQLIEI